MKSIITKLILILGISLSAGILRSQDPVDYVNPFIGGIGHLLTATTPDVQVPRGMVRLFPQTTPGIRDNYLADKIYSFCVTSLSNDFSSGQPLFSVMPTIDNVTSDAASNASWYDHDLEKATPYYYYVNLEDNNIEAEYTVAQHSAYYRFTFPEAASANLLIGMLQSAEIRMIGDNVLEGFQTYSRGHYAGKKLFFHAEIDRKMNTSGTWTGKDLVKDTKQVSGRNIGFFTSFPTKKGDRAEIKVGFSFISSEQAAFNLRKEIPGWEFEKIKKDCREQWNSMLGRVKITGGTEEQRRIFYTAMYRVFGRKTTAISEYGKYYSSFDDKVHQTGDHEIYQPGESWGSFRSLYPLGLLLEPERQNDFIRSYVLMFDQKGYLGDAALGRRVMIGRHESGSVADAYFKGFRDFDVEKAYAGMKKNAMETTMIPWRNGPSTELDTIYYDKGFFPALPLDGKELVKEVDGFEKRQAVAVTLEHAYDDWCVAQMAKSLSKMDDYEYFMRRAANYMNVWDEKTGFMAPKTEDGNWVFREKPLDPILSGGQGGREYYTETNAWTYTFHVQHDIEGLISLMGGNENFVNKLNAYFQEQYGGSKFEFLNQFPDGTGLIGQYNHGNQPGFHISYMYNYAGAPWLTQRRVRDIMKVWYNDGPLGICGDEDEGELSSWYIFSSLGFFPVCPGKPVYDIGSPLFSKSEISVGNGKIFTVVATDVSAANKYIQSATLNAKPHNVPWISHSDITSGGTLVLQMGLRPNMEWGRTR